jgi:SAM-dependent methyltransferase
MITSINEFNKEHVFQFYNVQRRKWSDNAQKVGWTSKHNQIVRFQKLLDVGVLNRETIIDFGCGYGDLYDYIKKKKLEIKYIGVDINPEYIKDAIETHRTNFKHLDSFEQDCKFYVIETVDDIKDRYDWFFASGSFTLSFTFPEILNILSKVYARSTRGVAFNLLKYPGITTYTRMSGNLDYYEYNPDWVVSELKKNFPNVEKVEDYLANDATYYLRK